MGRILFVLSLSLACLAQTPAPAETRALSQREAIELALASHPLLDSAASRLEAADALKAQAARTLNPRLVLQVENMRPSSNAYPFVYFRDTDQFVYLQQTLEVGGKRNTRVALAESNRERSGLDRELLRQQIAARVASAYWAAIRAYRIHALLMESAVNLQQVVAYHEIRVKEGALAEADLLRVRLEAHRLKGETNRAFLAAERARILLFREMGQREFPPVRFTDRLEDALAEAVVADVARALEQRAEIKVARAQSGQARANLAVQSALAKPNVDVLFGLKRTGGLNTMLGGVQWDLPVRNKNEGNIAAAGVEIRVAESNLAAAVALVRAEFEAAQSAYQLYLSDVVTFLDPLQRDSAETYRIAEAAYREGGADLLRLLEARRFGIESRMAYVQGLTEVRQAGIELQAAMGTLAP